MNVTVVAAVYNTQQRRSARLFLDATRYYGIVFRLGMGTTHDTIDGISTIDGIATIHTVTIHRSYGKVVYSTIFVTFV